jgi:glycosyltransferase involved in cell wall biosynthesis
MSSISAIVITYNEELNIEECLVTLKFADEIIVVDSKSTDNTAALAKKYTENIIVVDNLPYGKKKNIGIENALSDWILWIDADERISDELKLEIIDITKTGNLNAYYINRKSFFINKFIKHCGWYPDYTLRLFKRVTGIKFDTAQVHEKISFKGKTGKLNNEILHYTDRDIDHYVDKLNRYTSLSASELNKKNRSTRVLDIIFRPVFTFLKMYFFKLGILDGFTGLILCVLSSYHVVFKYIKFNSLNK